MSSATLLSVLSVLIQVTNEDVAQYWSHNQPLDYPSIDRSPTGLHKDDHDPLSSAVQSVFNTPHCLSSLYFISLSERILWEIVSKALLKSS